MTMKTKCRYCGDMFEKEVATACRAGRRPDGDVCDPKTAEDLLAETRETIRWMAQTFHQGHHLDQKGTFMECPKNTCDAARQALENK